MRLPWVVGVEDFTGCTVSGTFAVTLSGRHEVKGNDFSQAVGVRFLDGVDLSQNKFATDGSQIVVRRDHDSWRSVLGRADAGDVVALDLKRKLSGRQTWAVLYESQTDAQDWRYYASLYGPAVSNRSNVVQRPEESLGLGAIYFLVAANDAEAWRKALFQAAPLAFDVHLTVSGLQALGASMGVDPAAAATRVHETDEKVLVRLSSQLVRALRELSDRDELLSRWSALVAAGPEGRWADDPMAVLQALVAASSEAADDQQLYAVMMA
jgi:hypothetical protein